MDTIIELLIDMSNSMGNHDDKTGKNYLLPDGSTRMSLAKDVLLTSIIPSLNYSGIINIRTFYSGRKSELVLGEVFNQKFNQEAIITKIQEIKDPINTGGTPLSSALESSIQVLKSSSALDKKIILVTDGEENPGGDFVKTAETAIREDGIAYSLFIIGIGLNEVAEAKCKQATEITKGFHVNLRAKNYDKKELAEQMRSLTFNAVASSVKNLVSKNQADMKSLPSVPLSSSSAIQQNPVTNQEIGHVKTILNNYATQFTLFDRQLSSLNEQMLGLKKYSESCPKVSDLQLLHKNHSDSFNHLLQFISEFKQQQSIEFARLNKAIEDQNTSIKLISSDLIEQITFKMDDLKAQTSQQKNEILNEVTRSGHQRESTLEKRIDILISRGGYESSILFLLIICVSLLSLLVFRSYF